MSAQIIGKPPHAGSPVVQTPGSQAHVQQTVPHGNQSSAVYLSPAEFRMKVLKKLIGSDRLPESGNNIRNLQRQDSDRTLKASIYFPNGEIGTLISCEKADTKKTSASETEKLPQRSEISVIDLQKLKQRPLRLAPIKLPPIYNMKPLPVVPRSSYDREQRSSSFTDDDLADLMECRYLRKYSPRKRIQSASAIYG